ncbi:hypothetical protein [Chryseobacterium sp.]|uniref:hypothetical protein n=1 Tax=Chryseobacterium sp. TaxID=1871047 RepID=UPI0011CA8EBB|nr:hypothetical protein [Chryseobacterium sp.]TXF77345.1 hypothetical protein FUA25_05275 [Chryseobacterium sp.]
MKTIPQINFSKSIEKKWLVYKESFFDRLDTFTHIIAALGICFATFMVLKNEQNLNENEKFFIYLSGLISLSFCYITYKKLTEKRLKVVVTKCNEEQNRAMLKKLSESNGWVEFRNDSNVFVFYEDAGNQNTYIKILFLQNNKIYFTVLTERFRLNYPTFTENRSLKKLLENSAHN